MPPAATRTLAGLILAAATACADAEPEPPLRVGDVAFTEDQLLGISDDQRQLLADLTGFAGAVSRGEVDALGRPLIERREREVLARLYRAERALDSMGVSDDMLRARYRTDPEWELTVRHLIALSERYESDTQRREAQAKARRALDRIRAGEPFPEVAAEVSEEPGAEARQGLLQPGRRGAWVSEFWDAAAALDVGEVSPVVETQYGFHVIRLEGRDTVPFEEARPRVLLDAAGLMGVADGAPWDAVPAPPGLVVDRELIDRVPVDSVPDSLAVARWEGGSLSLGELRDHLSTLPLEEWRVAIEGGTERRVGLAERAARLRIAADSARARGLEVPASVSAELDETWRATTDRWTAALGLRAGLPPGEVAAAALDALGASRQNAAIARSEIRQQRPLVRRSWPARFPARDADGPGPDGP